MGSSKYLTFALDREEYAVPVLKVREIVKIMDITSVPQLPAYVKGVINRRGKVVPIIDMRLKFGLEARAYSDRTCIVVIEVATGSRAVMMGIIVDSVSEVINIAEEEVAAPPDFGGPNDGWIEALARV